ncbi:uncharacterized protein LOC141530601 [Cotesia typhae]|uniref:uncharacterized protein LOC141530601 n=1 Tax=Cotesia typhae TaxID=2053667 RepID=UPI003D691214
MGTISNLLAKIFNFILSLSMKCLLILDLIKLILSNNKSVNDPIIKTGPFAGLTLLHVACMENCQNLVKFLVINYKADVNVTAEDGIQPIHLACFFETLKPGPKIILTLIDAGANINAEIGIEIFSLYLKHKKWYNNFGKKMTLLTYAVLYYKETLTYYLARSGAEYKIKSPMNKTLLMYAFEYNYFAVALWTLEFMEKDPEYLCARDNEGMAAIHYILHPKKFGEFRYVAEQEQMPRTDRVMSRIVYLLAEKGADISALVNDDSETFLLNMAAYRSCDSLLDPLLPFYSDITHSRTLYNATLPFNEKSNKYLRIPKNQLHRSDELRRIIRRKRCNCFELIVRDIVNKSAIGFYVPKEESKLLDKFVASNEMTTQFVNDYKRRLIFRVIKRRFIQVEDEKMSLYEFIRLVVDEVKLKKLIKRNLTVEYNWRSRLINRNLDYNSYYFRVIIFEWICKARERLRLLEELKKISILRKVIPLPYEVVLNIVEYLRNGELHFFIKAFKNP